MPLLLAGLDDVGTETQLCEGWGIVLLDGAPADAFGRTTEKLLTNAPFSEFHGKKFKAAHEQLYREFLDALRAALELSSGGRAGFILQDEGWRSEHMAFLSRVSSGALSQAGISDQATLDGLINLARPFVLLQKFARGVPGRLCGIDIDAGSVRPRAGSRRINLPGGSTIAHTVFRAVYEGTRKQLFPSSPSADQGLIEVLRGRQSPLIQAADVIANFALAGIHVALGDQSPKRQTKARLMQEMGFSVSAEVVAALTLQGRDLKMMTDKELTLAIG